MEMLMQNSVSTDVDELFKALSAVQAAHVPVKADKANPYFQSRYATLQAVYESVLPLLQANGLCLIQRHLPSQPGTATIESWLHHLPSQQFIKSILVIPYKGDAQGLGSATTYARRYALATLLGVVVDPDDDGNKATDGAQNTPEGVKPPGNSARGQAAPPPRQRPPQIQRQAPQGPTTRQTQQPAPAPQGAARGPAGSQPPPQRGEPPYLAELPRLNGISYDQRQSQKGAFLVAMGNTRPHANALRAAGFQFHQKQALWWRYVAPTAAAA